MKIVIIGAGELGRQLAMTLSAEHHDVVIVDSDPEELKRLTDKLDVMTVEGSCSSVATLKAAGTESADALLAVSGDQADNIIACQIASRLGIRNTICRLYSSDNFSEEDGIDPESFGIWKTVVTPLETANKISSVLDNHIVMEKIRFSNPEAQMDVIEITPSCMLAGCRVKDIPAADMLKKVRFAAILRDNEILIPHGDTILVSGDRIYVAGHRKDLSDFLSVISEESQERAKRIVLSGSDETCRLIINQAGKWGCDIRCIVKDSSAGERFLDDLPSGAIVLNGDPTDEDILNEAGTAGADAFISVDTDDEDNILSCIVAKRLGAKKTISLTHKPEYIRIVPNMKMIDCAFSATLVAANSVLRLLESGTIRIDVQLQRFKASLAEFTISSKSPLCGKAVMELRFPASVVLALIFRGKDVITPSGDTVLQKDDIVVTIVTKESARELESMFSGK